MAKDVNPRRREPGTPEGVHISNKKGMIQAVGLDGERRRQRRKKLIAWGMQSFTYQLSSFYAVQLLVERVVRSPIDKRLRNDGGVSSFPQH